MDCVQTPISVLVLSDQLEPYRESLLGVGINARGFTKVSEFADCLPALVCAGLILDIPTVMRAESGDRDRLFALIKALPILRARVGKDGRAFFLDDVDAFVHNCRNVCPSRMRSAKRYPTRLNVLVSAEDDPAMVKTRPANILNISSTGCYVYALDAFETSSFIYLKILEFENASPILGLVRWRKPWGESHVLPGMGVAFLDILDGQVEEIESRRHLIPDPLAGCSESSPG